MSPDVVDVVGWQITQRRQYGGAVDVLVAHVPNLLFATIGILAIVGMLILPLPHWMLDIGLMLAIASSVVISRVAESCTVEARFTPRFAR